MKEDNIPTRPEDFTPLPVSEIRNQLVTIARAEEGPQDADKYWADVLPGLASNSYPPSWCGAFTLWVLHQAELAKDINWVIGLGYLYRLKMVRTPLPGDIAYFDKPYQHHAMVISAENGILRTVDGNQKGETVKIRTLRLSEGIYYSIGSLLPDATC